MTDAQARAAYKMAVEAVIAHFYGLSAERAWRLTESWWSELQTLRVFKSGLFMHPEVMNTAAEITGKRVLTIDDSNRDEYSAILQRSCETAIRIDRLAAKTRKKADLLEQDRRSRIQKRSYARPPQLGAA